jgi:hypothetical protein
MLNRLADRLRGRYERLDEQDIERAIEIIIDETDPRVRLVSGYRRKLRKPVIRSLVYVDKLVRRIPGPFEVSRKAYGSNPQVNALFGSADDVDSLFACSRALRGYFQDTPDCDRVFVPLAMYRQEKKIMGMSLDGDIVRRDVARTAVNFSNHRLGVCAASEAELRAKLKWRGIHNLAMTALENITRMKTSTAKLEEQSSLLKMKLRDIQAQRRGLDVLADAPGKGEQEWQALKSRLQDTERKLEEARTGLATLADYLVQVCRVFNHPSRYLQVRPVSVRVDRMGIKAEGVSPELGSEIVSASIGIGDKPPFEAILASFERTNMAASSGTDFL